MTSEVKSQDENIVDNKLFIDFLFFFILIPFLLTLVLVTPLNKLFVLHTSNPEVIPFYFSNYAHANILHLLENLIPYYLLISLIFRFHRDRHKFYIDMFLIFGLLPLLISSGNSILFPSRNALGFSGIVSALFSYLLYTIYIYIQEQYNLKFRYIIPLSIFGFSVFLIILKYQIVYSINLAYTILFFFVLLFTAIVYKSDLEEFIISTWDFIEIYIKKSLTSGKLIDVFFSLYIFMVLVILMIVIFLFLFPVNIENVNIFGHYIGYCFGLFAPLASRTLQKLGFYY